MRVTVVQFLMTLGKASVPVVVGLLALGAKEIGVTIDAGTLEVVASSLVSAVFIWLIKYVPLSA